MFSAGSSGWTPTWIGSRVRTWTGNCVRSWSAQCPTRLPSHRYPNPPFYPQPSSPSAFNQWAELSSRLPLPLTCFLLSLIGSPCDSYWSSLRPSTHTEPIQLNHFFFFSSTLTLIFLPPFSPFPFFLPYPCSLSVFSLSSLLLPRFPSWSRCPPL